MKKRLCGWGRTQFVKTNALRPEFISDIKSMFQTSSSLISYGCGRSYGDQALNKDSTLLLSRLNRFIAFDAEKLELICEGGVTLYDIQNTFLQRKAALITSPGTAFITVGGAIANDVHGKNHDRVGSFSEHVLWFDLLLANGEIIRCSRTENQKLFFATVGGMGLTGIIITACLQLQKHPIGVRVQNELIPDIATMIAQLRIAREQSTYSVAWIDMISRKNFGRGILSTGEPDETDDLGLKKTEVKISVAAPILLIGKYFLNRFTMHLFNLLYYTRLEKKQKPAIQTLMQFLYPLDAIKNWNKIYGKKGFYQFQCVIPDECAETGIFEIINTVKKSSHVPYLVVLKTLGKNGEGLLSFPMRGFTVALDFPNHKDVLSLLKQLEIITLKYKGRVYLAKDACLQPEDFPVMYPKLPEFQIILKEVDPDKKWQSEMSRRLKI